MKILLSIDGSKCSSEAIESVTKMKLPKGAEIKVISVVDFAESLPSIEGAKEKEIEAVQDLLDTTVERLKTIHSQASVAGEILDGYTTEEILKTSEEWQADLVVMGSHGRSRLRDYVVGGVSRAVLTHAKCAVRIVRLPKSKDEVEQKYIKGGLNVILAIEDSRHGKHLIDHTLKFAWPAGTSFRCINVIEKVEDNLLFDPDVDFAETLAKHYDSTIHTRKIWLKEATEKLNDVVQDGAASSEVLIGHPREEILKAAREWPANLILLGSHGRQGIERITMGSVSEAVATHAKCSVEVTRIPAIREVAQKAQAKMVV